MTEEEVAVLHANDDFYTAFSARDLEAMEAIWALESPVTCCHPGTAVLVGRDRVQASWRAILANPHSPRIRCFRPRAFLLGELAYVVCLEGEEGRPPLLTATNVFVREEGMWRIVHHHAGQLASEPDEEEGKPLN